MSAYDASAHDGGQQATFDANQYQPQPLDQQLVQQAQQQPTPPTPGNDGTPGKVKVRRSSPIPRSEYRLPSIPCHQRAHIDRLF